MSTPLPGRSPRSDLGGRDLLAALVGLALVALLLAGLSRACSFSPGGPDTSGAARPQVDPTAELVEAAAAVPFPVRVPRLPLGWQANSSAVQPVGGQGAQVVQIGWLTPSGAYLQLSQSSAPAEVLVPAETGEQFAAIGAVPLNGVSWVVYPAVRDERAWVADLGEARLLITGSGSEQQFRILAAAAQAAPPLH